jgi:sugar-specific transcriptional regulator TrmB/DNA-binding CsgD family transcriptional regulator
MAMLSAVGVSESEEELYLTVLRQPGLGSAELRERTGMAPTKVNTGLARLEELSLVRRHGNRPVRFSPAPPHGAVMSLVHRHHAELDQVAQAVAQLVKRFDSGAVESDPTALVEVRVGAREARDYFQELQAATTSELLVFDRRTDPELNTGEVDAEIPLLQRGVDVRGVYERAELEDPQRLKAVAQLCYAGEQARVSTRVPMKLAIFDRRAAMLPLTASDKTRTESWVVVHPSALLDALVELFEAYWRSSTPLRHGRLLKERQLAPGDREILTMLSAGLTDETIAKHMGMSHRTVRRRLALLFELLGVSTRFQAGLEAGKQGWM